MLATRLAVLALSLLAAPSIWPQTAPLVDILASELTRNFEALKVNGSPPPYFMSYAVTDIREDIVRASLGALSRNGAERRRTFDCSVRVGEPQVDNYHKLDGQLPRFTRGLALPWEDLAAPIRRIVWSETDRSYQAAVRRLVEVNSRTQTYGAPKSPVADFSAEPGVKSISRADPRKFDRDAWANRLRRLSAAFWEFPGVLQSEITASNQTVTRVIVNTEGTSVQADSNISRVVITTSAKAPDGEDLRLYDSFEAFDPQKLPNDNTLLQALILQADLMTRLKRASEAESFVGPALFSGRAAAELFHEVLGHGIEGHGVDGAALSTQLNQPILPDTFTVTSAPTIAQVGANDLIGAYTHDDEGVPARPVVVVEKGVLKSLLVSRTPTTGFPQSNGHGRRQPGFEVAARQSNLFIESSVTLQNDDLKAQLVAAATRQNKPYGLYVERIRIGDPIPGQGGAQTRPIILVSAYRIFTSGQKDELVRGAALEGDLLKLLRKIIAAGDFKQALNLYDQGESGRLPVAVVAPPVLISEVEIKRTVKPGDRPPFLPRPSVN